MANWANTVVTQLGLNLQAKLQAGEQLVFTRAVSGSGYANPDTLLRLTDIADQKQTLLLSSVIPKADGKAALPVSLSNHGLMASYTLQQIGVFATDPDLGEILYLAAQATDPDVIPTAAAMPDFFIEYTFNLIFANAGSIKVTLDPTALATKGDIINAISEKTGVEGGMAAFDDSYTKAQVDAHLSNKVSKTGGVIDGALTIQSKNPHTAEEWQTSGFALTDVDGIRTCWIGVAGKSNGVCEAWLVNDKGDINLKSNSGVVRIGNEIAATATPPQEFDLPLAEGFTDAESGGYYWKAQDNICTVAISCKRVSESSPTGILGTLPVGYRPARLVIVPLYLATKEASTYVGIIRIFPDGNVQIWSPIPITEVDYLCAQVSFVAAQ